LFVIVSQAEVLSFSKTFNISMQRSTEEAGPSD